MTSEEGSKRNDRMTAYLGLSKLTLDAVQAHATKIKWTADGEWTASIQSPNTPYAFKLGMLIREMGKVGAAIHFDIEDDSTALVQALLRTAAVALMWAEILDGGKPRE